VAATEQTSLLVAANARASSKRLSAAQTTERPNSGLRAPASQTNGTARLCVDPLAGCESL